MTWVKSTMWRLFLFFCVVLAKTFSETSESLCKNRTDANKLDQEDCEKEVLLLYTMVEINKHLRNQRSSLWIETITSKNSSLSNATKHVSYYSVDKAEIISAAISGPYMYLAMNYSKKLVTPTHMVQINKNGTIISEMIIDHSGNLQLKTRNMNTSDYFLYTTRMNVAHDDKIRTLAVDWITENIYFLIEMYSTYSWIQVCTANRKFCTLLTNRLMQNPKTFALSPADGLLFWIEQKSNYNYIIAKSFMDGSFPSVIELNLQSATSLAVDVPVKRLYYIQKNRIFSLRFDGTDKQILDAFYGPGISLSSVAAHNDDVFWTNNMGKAIYNCNSHYCINYTSDTFEKIYNLSSISILGIYGPEEGKPKLKNPCDDILCSEICLLQTNITYSCRCTNRKFRLSSNEVYCERSTLLATYGNDLYVIGAAFFEIPKIQRTSLKLRSISAVTYESLQGHVILAEVGEENIYLWSPKEQKLELIMSGGPGNIKTLEFDDYGNNVYWLNTETYTINVLSLHTRTRTVVYEGNSTHVPLDFALAPKEKLMFIAFLEANSSVVLRHAFMDGTIKHRNTMYTITENRLDKLTIHYARDLDLLFFIDEQFQELVYFLQASDTLEMKLADFSKSIHKATTRNLSDSLTSLEGMNIFWTEETLNIYHKNLIYLMSSSEMVNEINLDIKEVGNNKKLKITGVIKSTVKYSPCHENNGDCQHLCLASRKDFHICACKKGHVLEGHGTCKLSSHIMSQLADKKNSETSNNHPLLIFVFVMAILATISIYIYFVGFDEIGKTFSSC